ncbi:MAG: hypothetical protein PVI23_14410, partial [Maricaulaceae bacterium]
MSIRIQYNLTVLVRPDLENMKALTDTSDATLLARLQTLAGSRRVSLPMRVGISVVVTVILWTLVEPTIALTYLSVVLATQLLDTLTYEPFRRKGRTAPPSRSELLACVAAAAAATGVYISASFFLWRTQDTIAQVIAIILLFGSLVHSVLHVSYVRRIFIASIIPICLVLVCLPV